MEAPSNRHIPLIQAGKMCYDNLMKAGLNEPWLRETLSQLQIYDLRDVRFALLDPSGSVHVLYA
ncbi:DUF421 domain-containing protein [Tumebacillus sp. ITR2]|uniref:DUF421 domain-containing protein n=1 Tax=Tumebacillus amylolyticus TaxID=2801339 RepID=A0ABS1J9X4_9BACL|nr:YetF domain-containing protein [Tumebacillus amylolyticus]MBL0386839.1 DUF421 domain-containing protein [Tumebacillus amylolyticus]